MQKLWFSKSKQPQPSPPAEESLSSSASETTPEQTSQETNLPAKTFEWEASAAWFFVALGVGGVIMVAMFGLQYLTAPEATPDSNLICKSKIGGDWQTPFGKVTLQSEAENLVSGKYEYTNFERGKISGELTGRLNKNVLSFDWQETPNQQPKQQGKGIIVFGEGCQEFYGSYGIGGSTNNFGNWQGSRLLK
ncbi:hypothetical protein [Pseudanabaena sp. UWO310]|uniref:hypothetical protein n=1 Tax=Pseudanabaena sp. UWO310 TaxID=2480795 RepID=UPI00115BDAA4|nr:hypothetical protein [Pseudanabaena sp. UWO310]TYQ27129.1 hypothetical protein PseudUWO310_16310 [Pseudanabaena sp. UWO310]